MCVKKKNKPVSVDAQIETFDDKKMSWQLTECLKPIASGLNTVLDYDLFVKIFIFKKSL